MQWICEVDVDVDVRDGFLRGDRQTAGDEEDGLEAEGGRFASRSF